MNLVKIKSAKAFIDAEELIVYPLLEETGKPELNMGIHANELPEVWFDSLSLEDNELLMNIL
jgi:hypothetical protein